jgi:hypothetical protein
MSFLSNITKLWNSIFSNYKLSVEESEFINENRKCWKNNNNQKIGIIVEGFLYSPTSVIEKARIAKALEEKLNVSILVLLRGFSKKSSNVYAVYKSFAIDNFLMWWAQYLNIPLLIKIFVKTLYVYIKYPRGKDLLSLQYNDIMIGDLIYDTLIRFNPGTYTIQKLNFKKHFRHIFRTLYSIEINEKLFNKYDIKAVVTSHNVYSEYGILCRIAYKYKADVYLKDMNVFKYYDGSIPINEHFLKIKYSDLSEALENTKIIKKAENYLESRFNGSDNQIDVKNAYRNKKTYSKNELFEYFKIKNLKNKNIFILAHAFSDAPHVGEGLLFNDYYHWLIETLKMLSKVENINIFVKPHPSSYMWNESGVVEKMVIEENIKNINILPKDFNTNSIKNIADCILTAQGTAGLEFSCFGIPAIIAGKGFYSGFSIAIEPKTIEEYKNIIHEIKSIKKLDQKTIKKAKILLYLSMQNLIRSEILPKEDIFPGDNYDEKYKEQYKEVAYKLKNGIKMKDDFYKSIIEMEKDNNA